MENKIVGKYNGFSFILFPGSGCSYKSWDLSYLNSKDLSLLKKPIDTCLTKTLSEISQVFMYTPYEYINIHGYHKFVSGKIKYPINKELSIELHCKRINDLLKKKKVKGPYVLIGHSIGAFYSLVFAKLFSKEVKEVILIDPTCNTNEHKKFIENDFKMRFDRGDMFFEKDDQFTKKMISGMASFLDQFCKQNKNDTFKNYVSHQVLDFFFSKLSYHWFLKYSDQIPDKIASHIKIISLFNIETKKQGFYDINKQVKAYNKILKENNKNYKSFLFKDRSHFLHHSDPEKVLKIIKDNLTI